MKKSYRHLYDEEMFRSIWDVDEIITKVSRNYLEYPKTYKEKLLYDDLFYLYITANCSLDFISWFVDASKPCIESQLNFYKIKKGGRLATKIKDAICQYKYGVNCHRNRPEVNQKIQSTIDSKSKEERSLIAKKASETYYNKTGYTNPLKNPNVKESIAQTNLNKYGDRVIFKTDYFKETSKETLLKERGVDNISKDPNIKRKKKETFTKNFPTKESIQEWLQIKAICRKLKNGYAWAVEKPDYDFNTFQHKRYLTMTKNKSHIRSPEEIFIEVQLLKIFKEVKTNYKTELYPFKCDFYIPEIDLYIEYQGYGTHYTEPYDPSNIKHQKILEKRKIRAKNHKWEQTFIKVWTITDPLKRETANKNNLNWLEFFTLKEFNTWFSFYDKEKLDYF